MAKNSSTKSDPAKDIARAIRRAYTGKLKQADLARAIGVSQQTISRWVNGDNTPGLPELAELEDACGRPRGFILRTAGLVAECQGVEAAIDADPALTDGLREPLKAAYRAMLAEVARQ